MEPLADGALKVESLLGTLKEEPLAEGALKVKSLLGTLKEKLPVGLAEGLEASIAGAGFCFGVNAVMVVVGLAGDAACLT